MSLHVDMTYCHGRMTGGASKEIFWTARCDCGWAGDERSTSEDSDAAPMARRDYRAHVEAVLGADAYYSAPVACRNCGSEHEQGVLVGTRVISGACVCCGTTMLNPRNEAWDESRAPADGGWDDPSF